MLAMIRKSKKTLPPRKMSLQSNTMFHLGGFLNPMDGLVKRFTVLFVKDTEFTGDFYKFNFTNMMYKYKVQERECWRRCTSTDPIM